VQLKIQKLLNKIPIKQLQDVRVLGLIAFGLIVLMITWSGIGAIETNYNLQKQINQLSEQNQLQKLANINQSLENEYYNTNQYLVLQARELLSKGQPGERLFLVSNTAAMSQISPEPKSLVAVSPTVKPKYQTDFENWIDFYFRHGKS
jgi:cell division protein FtsB